MASKIFLGTALACGVASTLWSTMANWSWTTRHFPIAWKLSVLSLYFFHFEFIKINVIPLLSGHRDRIIELWPRWRPQPTPWWCHVRTGIDQSAATLVLLSSLTSFAATYCLSCCADCCRSALREHEGHVNEDDGAWNLWSDFKSFTASERLKSSTNICVYQHKRNFKQINDCRRVGHAFMKYWSKSSTHIQEVKPHLPCMYVEGVSCLVWGSFADDPILRTFFAARYEKLTSKA